MWPDKNHTGALTRLGERGVFRQKTVAGVDGVSAELSGESDQLGTVKITGAGFSRTEVRSFVRHTNKHGMAVRLRVHSQRADAETTARFDNAHGNFAAIGNADFLKHR